MYVAMMHAHRALQKLVSPLSYRNKTVITFLLSTEMAYTYRGYLKLRNVFLHSMKLLEIC